MKVLFIQDTLINAGTEKSLLQILPLFSTKVDYKVVYFYPRHDLKNQYLDAQIPLVFLNLKGKYDFWNGITKLIKLIKKDKPDLLVSSLLRSNLISRVVSIITGVPLIGTFVSDSYNNYNIELRKGIQYYKFKFFWGLDRITSSLPKLYIANSKFIAQSHIITLGVPFVKIKVIYRGRMVNDHVWEKKYNSKFRFLSYGRLLQIKGFEEMIKAFSKIISIYPESTLEIYGEGLYRRELEQQIEILGLDHYVFLPGAITNVTEKLFEADCFIFPSWYEGFSGALVEAMMAGIPIIASDIPMNLEAVTSDYNALIFPVRDVDELSKKMMFAIEHHDDVVELGKRARETAIERFDIKKIAVEYEQVLHEVYETQRK